jgi:hypothetical protein
MLITAEDFEALSNTKMQWAGIDWDSQAKRFNAELYNDWDWAYWFDDAASMILAKAFLDQNIRGFQCAYDDGSENYIIVTNYDSAKVGA